MWRTGKAKVIPEKLCRALAYSHIKHAETLKCEGNDSIPEHLTEVINALNGLHDPYDENAKDMFMKSDFSQKLNEVGTPEVSELKHRADVLPITCQSGFWVVFASGRWRQL